MPTVEGAAERPVGAHRGRRVVLAVFLGALIGGAVWFLGFTERGAVIRQDPRKLGEEFGAFVRAYPLAAPVGFIALYTATGLCLLPVWWLKLIAGYAFGVWAGAGWCLAGAAVGAAAGFLISRELLGEWMHERFEARHARLRALDERLGRRGLLVVIVVRLIGVVPFGVANYVLGMSRVRLHEVVLGTVIGNLPIIMVYVAIGAGVKWW